MNCVFTSCKRVHVSLYVCITMHHAQSMQQQHTGFKEGSMRILSEVLWTWQVRDVWQKRRTYKI